MQIQSNSLWFMILLITGPISAGGLTGPETMTEEFFKTFCAATPDRILESASCIPGGQPVSLKA